jgi:hypothetical protein
VSSQSVLQHPRDVFVRRPPTPFDVFSGLVASSQDVRVAGVGDDHGGAAEELATARAEFKLAVPTSAIAVLQSLVSERFFAGPVLALGVKWRGGYRRSAQGSPEV